MPSPLTIEEYLVQERQATLRHEYHRGQLFSMAGGTRNHGALGNAINTELNLICRQKPCRPFNGDVRIRIDAANCFLYPEASLVCGPIATSPFDPDALTNPLLIAEVLSTSTEAYDRGEKFRLYRQLPAFREYVLIDQYRPLVEVFSRQDENSWEMRVYSGLTAHIHLPQLGASIAMVDLYRHVEDLPV